MAGINIYAAATHGNVGAVVTDANVTLSAAILSDGGQGITEKGFIYGTSAGALTNTITSAEITAAFHAVVSGLEGGTWYFKAYATNSQGTTFSTVQTFVAVDTLKIYFQGVKFAKAYLGTNQLKYN